MLYLIPMDVNKSKKGDIIKNTPIIVVMLVLIVLFNFFIILPIFLLKILTFLLYLYRCKLFHILNQ